jgi:hypothetical protein
VSVLYQMLSVEREKKFDIFDNCNRRSFCDAFRRGCDFCLKFFKLIGLSISGNNLPTVMGSVIPDPLITVQLSHPFSNDPVYSIIELLKLI